MNDPARPPVDHARWIAGLCWLLLLLAIPAAYRLYLGSGLAADGTILPPRAALSLYPLLGFSYPLIQIVTWALLLELGAFTFALHSRQRPLLKPPPTYPAYLAAVAPAAFFGQLWRGGATGAAGRPAGERLPIWLYLVMLAFFLVGLVQTFILWVELTKRVDDAQTALAPLMRGATGVVLLGATAFLAGGLLVLVPRLLAGQGLPSRPPVEEAPGLGLRHAWRAYLALLALSTLLQVPASYPGPARLEAYIGLIACLAVLVLFTRHALSAFEVRSRRQIQLLELGAVLLLAAQGLAFTSRSPLSRWIKNMMESEFVPLPGLPAWAFILIAPLLYELLFRGLIYEGLARRLPALAAAAIAAYLFATVAAQPGYFVQVFLLGLTAGLVKGAFGSVWPAVLVHAATNSLLMLSRMGKFFAFGKAPFLLAVLLTSLGAAILYLRSRRQAAAGGAS